MFVFSCFILVDKYGRNVNDYKFSNIRLSFEL